MSMSLIGRVKSGPGAGACRCTATLPRTRTSTPLSVAASTSRRASTMGSCSGVLSSGEEEVDVAAILSEVHDSAAQHVGGVVAPRVEAHRDADLLRGARLVDVPVQP